MAGLSRRRFLSGGAAVAGGAVAANLIPAQAADAATAATAGRTKGHKRTGTIKDVKHVIILMQENRSFDHYYGNLGGVAGLGDPRALPYPDGSTVFSQPDPSRTDGHTLLPWHLDTSKFDAQQAGDLDHSWPGTHAAWNAGAWNQWVTVKGEETMGFFNRTDIPWQYALADAFTICDHYFCSIQGPTTPNRLFHWSGMIDPAGTAGGPAISNPDDYQPVYSWKTYPERLQAAGVSWQVYANDEVGDGGGIDGYVGDYGDNPLWLFQAYHDALASTDPAIHQLADRASLRAAWKPDSGQGKDLDHLLEQFIADCKSGTLPTVSWVVAPYAYSEHPAARPVDGANYTQRMLQAIWDNQELWESSIVLLNYDENDGFFDHATPPFAAPGTPAEYVHGLPVGLGPRVPMTVVSPWSRGGWVNSQVFDHTSVLRFLEVLTGIEETNISDWRRSVCGDLLSCFDFSTFDASLPNLPDTAALVRIADNEQSLPQPSTPAVGTQRMPKPEYASRPQRPLPYQPQVDLAVHQVSGLLTATARNAGTAAISLAVYDNTTPVLAASPLLVDAHDRQSWKGASVDGHYDLTVLGPNSFLRRFQGQLSRAGRGVPSVTSSIVGGKNPRLRLTLSNDGAKPVSFTLTGNDFTNHHEKVTVQRHRSLTVEWPLKKGWYDLSITADTGETFSYRYAGKVESH
ncbi:MAG: phospholipase C, phosphocholine-specific [Actinomycetota bacterium]|nr:phospholipase C, phosphocholine-specific [Actinomycetota bacterium]